MKLFTLVHKGLEELAKQEVKELLNVDSESFSQVVSSDIEKKDLFKYLSRNQSSKRVLLSVDNGKIEDMDYSSINWKDVLSKELTMKVTVEGVSGSEKRIDLAKQVMGKLSSIIGKQCDFDVKINLKKPDIEVMVFFNGKKYFIGVDLAGELNDRAYRLFPHQASFKGDLAYYFLRKSGIQKGEKVLVGYMKDGTLAIEASLYLENSMVSSPPFVVEKMPGFQNLAKYELKQNEPNTVIAFDSGVQSFIAARKNVKISKTNVQVKKWALDELDTVCDEKSFDRLIFHITSKDEVKLNEIYYQAKNLLKPKGTILLIGREHWEVSLSEKFVLKEHSKLVHGNGAYGLWLLEKK
ncbi:hypothetical protein HOI26_00025 [Candidatus Woesearchaeota archaeon]|jgi:23S rRNA G2445 N2-methylase RlmL|nr:hypothetical protein [Candidatus Woesearchaeota archaeon]MBT5739461.1 hypothetical protein [Candidatus Woesearchaeota archaeon]